MGESGNAQHNSKQSTMPDKPYFGPPEQGVFSSDSSDQGQPVGNGNTRWGLPEFWSPILRHAGKAARPLASRTCVNAMQPSHCRRLLRQRCVKGHAACRIYGDSREFTTWSMTQGTQSGFSASLRSSARGLDRVGVVSISRSFHTIGRVRPATVPLNSSVYLPSGNGPKLN